MIGGQRERGALGDPVISTWMAKSGGVVPGYEETPVAAHGNGREVEIAFALGLGRGQPHGCIAINGNCRS